MYVLISSLVFVVLTSCILLIGNDARKCQGRGYLAVLHFLSDSPGRHGDRYYL